MKLTLKNTTIALATTLASLALSTPVKAIELTFGGTTVGGQGIYSSVAGATTINFNNGLPSTGIATYSGTKANSLVTGGVSSDHGNPAGDNSQYLTISPSSSSASGNTNTVAINFAKAVNYFGLYWGSADNYNNISFYNGAKLIATYLGGNVAQLANGIANGSWTSSDANFYANFSAGQGETFDKVVLGATGVAFESDNHAYREAEAVPEPITMTGLALGLGSMISARRRKAQKA